MTVARATAAGGSVVPQFCFNTFNRSSYLGVEPDLPGQLAAAAEAGFQWFGPDIFSLDAWVDSGQRLEDLSALLDQHGLGCWEIAGLDIGEPEVTLAAAAHVAEVAAVLRPSWILTNVSVAPEAACETLARVCDILEPSGARPAIEYLPFTPVPSIAAARTLVDHVGVARSGILFDVWHHFRGPDTDAQLEAAPLELVAYLQFDDALPMIGDDLVEETLHRRAFPGEGEFDLDGWCGRMRKKGFDGVVSVEVLNAEWRDRPLPEFARRAFDTTARYWS